MIRSARTTTRRQRIPRPTYSSRSLVSAASICAALALMLVYGPTSRDQGTHATIAAAPHSAEVEATRNPSADAASDPVTGASPESDQAATTPGTYLRLASTPGSTVHAVRFGDDAWRTLGADETVPLPSSPGRLTAGDNRSVHTFEALVTYDVGGAVVVRGDVLDGTSTTILIDHPITGPISDMMGDTLLGIALEARPQRGSASGFQALTATGEVQALPGLIGLRPGSNHIQITHATPERIDETHVTLRFEEGLILADPSLAAAVTLQQRHAFGILNASRSALRVSGRSITSTLLQTYVSGVAATTVRTPDGDTLWHAHVDRDLLLIVVDATPATPDVDGSVTRRSAIRDAGHSCEDALATNLRSLYPLFTTTYPTGFFGRKTGVDDHYSGTTATVTRTAPFDLSTAHRTYSGTYECIYDATTSHVRTLTIRSDESLPAVRGLTTDIVTADDATLIEFGLPTLDATEAGPEWELQYPRHLAQQQLNDLLVVGPHTEDGSWPVTLLLVGPDAMALEIQAITLVVPVIQFATTRFVPTDPDATVSITIDGDEGPTDAGAVLVRAPVGATLRASAQSAADSRYRSAHVTETQSTRDQTIDLQQRREVTVRFDTNAPGATLRIPGVIEDALPLPTQLDLLADIEYRVIIEATDDGWFSSTRMMRFSQDSDTTVELTRAATITFTSDPPGARITVSGHPSTRTPVTVQLAVGTSVPYRIDADAPRHKGYEGSITVTGDAEHPTYLERYTEAELRAMESPTPPPRPSPSATTRPAGTSTASELANGLRRSIGGRSMPCGDDLTRNGATCFVTLYLQATTNRLIDSILGDLPGVRFESAWMRSGVGQGRAFSYAGRSFMIMTAYIDIVETLVVVVPY